MGDEIASGVAMVVPGGRRIEVDRGFDVETLKRLLAVVERG
jgi:chemotaxis response regulator CheB